MNNAFLSLSIAYRLSAKKTPQERDIYSSLRKRAKMVAINSSYVGVDWEGLDNLDSKIDAALSDYGPEGRLYNHFKRKYDDEKDTSKIIRKS